MVHKNTHSHFHLGIHSLLRERDTNINYHKNKFKIASLINTKKGKFVVKWDTEEYLKFQTPVMVG